MQTKVGTLKRIRHHAARHAKKAHGHLKDHFVPHAGNGHHPHLLKHRVLFGLTAVMFALKALAITSAAFYPSFGSHALAITPANVLALVNDARAAAGLGSLRLNAALGASAQNKAEDMAKNGYFAHNSPSGLTPWSFIKASGYRYARSAENLAVHYQTAEEAQGSWMASPAHRANVMNPVFVDLGVGVARGLFEGANTIFVVQHFGQPATQPTAVVQATTTQPVQPQTNVAPSTTAVPVKAEAASSSIAATATTSTVAAAKEKIPQEPKQATAVMRPTAQGFSLGVTDPKAVNVAATMGDRKVELAKTSEGQWSGDMPHESLEGAVQRSLEVVTVDGQGRSEKLVVAVLGEGSPVGTAGTTEKFLGVLDAWDFDRFMRLIGALLLAMISLALAAYFVVRLHVARPKVVGHALVTVALIAVLVAMK